MRKVIAILANLLLLLSVTALSVSAKGNVAYEDWVIENITTWQTTLGDVLLKGQGDGYVSRVVYGKHLNAAKGFYVQWDIQWNPSYEMINANWGLKAMGAGVNFRFGSRVKSMCGAFAMEVSYTDGSKWTALPVENSNWLNTDFFARMVLYVEAGSGTLHVEARDVNNQNVFSAIANKDSMTQNTFFDYPLEFWMGGDDSYPFNISNVTVLDSYDSFTVVPAEAATVEVQLISHASVTVPTLAAGPGGRETPTSQGLSVVQIVLLTAAGVLLIAAVIVAVWLLRKPTAQKKS